MANKNHIFKFWYFAIIFILLALYLIYNQVRKESLYQNGLVSNGYVYEINHASHKGSNIVIKYKYVVDGHMYYGGLDSPLPYNIRENLLHSSFPILYDSTHPGNSQLMIESRFWQKLNLEIPDTLSWLKKYLK